MRKIISQTEASAREYLSAFGFEEDQVRQLIDAGKRDIEEILNRLDMLLAQEEVDYPELDSALHALKGVLFQLGNHAQAEAIERIRTSPEEASATAEIVALLA